MTTNPINHYPADPILLVDDDRISRESIEFLMKSREIDHLIGADDPRRVMGILKNRTVELILLDLVMPHISGEDLLLQISEKYPEIPVVVITGVQDLDTAIRCMRRGAFDYLTKPVDESRMVYAIRRAVEFRKMRQEIECLQSHAHGCREARLEKPEAFAGMITRSPAMFALFRNVEAVSRSDMPVLVTGETGSGKSLLAESIHACSGRRGAFVGVSISGLDEGMFADTLFGHAKGAFPGADTAREGLFRKADGGTLFLDEIGDLSPACQVKLLKLIQDREYLPLGADTPRKVDLRIVTATHLDLSERVKAGHFRRDLYYRLHTHALPIPPLRERPEDIPLLLDHFLEKTCQALGRSKPSICKDVIPLLQNHPFPGNVRELASLVHDVATRDSGKTLKVEAVAEKLRNHATPPRLRSHCLREGNPFSQMNILPNYRDAMLMLVAESMRRAKGNKALAARLVGLSRQTLGKHHRKLEKELGVGNPC